MFHKILVPLDGSHASEVALPRALELVSHSPGTIQIVTVVEVGGGDGSVQTGGVDRAELVRAAEEYLDRAAHRAAAKASEVELSGHVLPNGRVVTSIIREMAAEEIDLVVMTTHGRGPLERAWLGSTADGVLRQAIRPVLLLRPSAGKEGDGTAEEAPERGSEPRIPPPFRRILVALDGSQDAEEALPHAREMARTEGALVTLVSVVPSSAAKAPPYLASASDGKTDAAAEEAAETARAELERLAEGLREEGVEVDVEVVRHDLPAVAIMEAARRIDASLLVMTTRGRGGAPRLIVGSVVDKVIRASDVPVLVHRPRRRDEE